MKMLSRVLLRDMGNTRGKKNSAVEKQKPGQTGVTV